TEEIHHDDDWRSLILEPVEILGVENFGDRGPVVRVWMKTQPIKQWDVSREFHRRLKLAFDDAEITIPAQQQEVWFQTANDMRLQLDGLTGNGRPDHRSGRRQGKGTATVGATPEATSRDGGDDGDSGEAE
ncbi:MAG: hypothetical protein ACR2FS_15690, partial [Phormidesmis sp.]